MSLGSSVSVQKTTLELLKLACKTSNVIEISSDHSSIRRRLEYGAMMYDRTFPKEDPKEESDGFDKDQYPLRSSHCKRDWKLDTLSYNNPSGGVGGAKVPNLPSLRWLPPLHIDTLVGCSEGYRCRIYGFEHHSWLATGTALCLNRFSSSGKPRFVVLSETDSETDPERLLLDHYVSVANRYSKQQNTLVISIGESSTALAFQEPEGCDLNRDFVRNNGPYCESKGQGDKVKDSSSRILENLDFPQSSSTCPEKMDKTRQDRKGPLSSDGRAAVNEVQRYILPIPPSPWNKDHVLQDHPRADAAQHHSDMFHTGLSRTPSLFLDPLKNCPIKCICGFVDDHGITMLCNECDTVQHLICYDDSA